MFNSMDQFQVYHLSARVSPERFAQRVFSSKVLIQQGEFERLQHLLNIWFGPVSIFHFLTYLQEHALLA